MVKNSQIG